MFGRIDAFVASSPERARNGESRQWRYEEHGKSGEVFDERRVLGVDAHVEIAHIAVGGGDMRLFIHGGRVIPGETKRNGKQGNEYSRDKPACVLFEELHNQS